MSPRFPGARLLHPESIALRTPCSNPDLVRKVCNFSGSGFRGASMTAVGVSSGIFRDIFSTEPMRRIFADENRVQKYLDIEAALARAQARLGIIPQEAAEEICRHCD